MPSTDFSELSVAPTKVIIFPLLYATSQSYVGEYSIKFALESTF